MEYGLPVTDYFIAEVCSNLMNIDCFEVLTETGVDAHHIFHIFLQHLHDKEYPPENLLSCLMCFNKCGVDFCGALTKFNLATSNTNNILNVLY